MRTTARVAARTVRAGEDAWASGVRRPATGPVRAASTRAARQSVQTRARAWESVMPCLLGLVCPSDEAARFCRVPCPLLSPSVIPALCRYPRPDGTHAPKRHRLPVTARNPSPRPSYGGTMACGRATRVTIGRASTRGTRHLRSRTRPEAGRAGAHARAPSRRRPRVSRAHRRRSG